MLDTPTGPGRLHSQEDAASADERRSPTGRGPSCEANVRERVHLLRTRSSTVRRPLLATQSRTMRSQVASGALECATRPGITGERRLATAARCQHAV
jgi:hypothetical protein